MMNLMRSVFKRSGLARRSRQTIDDHERHFSLNSLFVTPTTAPQRSVDRNEEDITLIWLTRHPEITEQHSLIGSLRPINDFIQVCHSEAEAITLLESIVDETVFLIVDYISDTILTDLATRKQIDSLFLFAPESPETIPTRVTAYCSDIISLVSRIKQARIQLEKQIAAFSVYDQKEKATRDLTRESGSFLFFQLFKLVLLNMTKNVQSKRMMISKCRDYYRGNAKETENINEFERKYKPSEAISWYTKDSFIYRLINKALRTEDVEALYHFRFYIVDLCVELKKSFIELKREEKDNVLRLYRGFKVSTEEMESFQHNVGNLISVNGFLSTSRDRKVAYEFATKPSNRPNIQRGLFQYNVDLTLVKKIVLADIAALSRFPTEAEVLFDLGASFQIDSCTYNSEEDLWLISASATDKGAEVASEYIEYQKAKVAESNIVLMFGHLLIETGAYAKAEKYFEAVLHSSNPNDEEIACIYHNIGRGYRLKGEYERALISLNRAYVAHREARPPRLISAARTINTIGIVNLEQGYFDQAEESFEQALKLYAKTVHRYHSDIGGTLVNLGDLHCQQERFEKALSCFTRAQKIYEESLPPNHPNTALAMNNRGIMHYRQKQYDLALNAFTQALAMKEQVLPEDHPDLARTAHNLAIVHAVLRHNEQVDTFFKRASKCTLPETYPFMKMLEKNMLKWKTAEEMGTPIEDIYLLVMDEYPVIRL